MLVTPQHDLYQIKTATDADALARGVDPSTLGITAVSGSKAVLYKRGDVLDVQINEAVQAMREGHVELVAKVDPNAIGFLWVAGSIAGETDINTDRLNLVSGVLKRITEYGTPAPIGAFVTPAT